MLVALSSKLTAASAWVGMRLQGLAYILEQHPLAHWKISFPSGYFWGESLIPICGGLAIFISGIRTFCPQGPLWDGNATNDPNCAWPPLPPPLPPSPLATMLLSEGRHIPGQKPSNSSEKPHGPEYVFLAVPLPHQSGQESLRTLCVISKFW